MVEAASASARTGQTIQARPCWQDRGRRRKREREEQEQEQEQKRMAAVAAGHKERVRGIWTWGPGVDGRRSKEDGGGEFVGWGRKTLDWTAAGATVQGREGGRRHCGTVNQQLPATE